MGAPVIAADHGGAREVVADGQTGWRAAPGDLEAWRAALHTALSLSLEARAALAGRAGRGRLSCFRNRRCKRLPCRSTVNF